MTTSSVEPQHEQLEWPLAKTCPLDPPARYAQLREQEPITKVSLFGRQTAWLVTNHADVRALLGDPRVSSDRSSEDFPQRARIQANQANQATLRRAFANVGQSLIGLDLPEHSAPRRMLINEFTVHRMQQLRPRIQEIVDGCIEDMLAAGNSADLVAALALPVPSMVICELLGVPVTDREFFQDRTKLLVRATTTADDRITAMNELEAFMAGLIREKTARPSDDLLSRLIARNSETKVFSHELLVGIAELLLIAGHETTANTIGLGAVGLLTRPDVAEQVRADPSLIHKTVEEVLRLYPIIDGLPRLAKADIEIGGITIRAGDGIMLSLASANRDETNFANAEDFDVQRGGRHHMSFAYGVHQCLGQNLARMELEIVFATLLRRVPTLKLAAEIDELSFKDPSVGINGLWELPVSW